MSDEIILRIENVSRSYQEDTENPVQALQDISLEVRRGEFICFIGPSGCGKTTLLRLIAGLDTPEAGTLTINGHEIHNTDPERGYVFQQGSLFPWLTVEQNIAAGLVARGVLRREKSEVARYVSLIGLEGFEKSFPHQISGGMAQRVAIARALINRPAALLLDEPMGALDSFTRADLQDKLLELWKQNHTTTLLVTHDVDEALYLSDRVVIMTPRPGRITEILTINLPRPRQRSGPEFSALRSSILEKLHLASTLPQPEYTI